MIAGVQTQSAIGAAPAIDADAALLSVALSVRPLADIRRRRPLGRAAHALLLRAIAWSRPVLAEAVHAISGPKPFTVSGVFDYMDRPTLRFTALTLDVAQALGRALMPGGPLSAGSLVDLDGIPFRVEAVATRREAHAWAGQTSYGSLALPWVYGQYEPEVRLAFEFASPTTFKSNGLNIPVPMPVWVFGSLLERWNAFAPVPLPDEVRAFAAERMALSHYELRTAAVPFKEGTVKFGVTGRATFTAPKPEAHVLSALNLLAEFAFFAGVGAQTTMGFGQCRPMRHA